MLDLDDKRWSELLGAYRIPYDASVPLRRMEAGESVWNDLCENLYHQGDVGEASYAALPQLVRICAARGTNWNLYALAAYVEVDRHRIKNPPIPAWLSESYREAWQRLIQLALRDLSESKDPMILRTALSVIPLGRGLLELGAFLTNADDDDVRTFIDARLAWSKLYINSSERQL